MDKQKQKTEILSMDEKIEDILHDLRGNKLAAINLVKKLEGDAFNSEEHDLELCQSYTTRLIQKYCKDASIDNLKDNRGKAKGSAEDRAELMLAACGLLRGFEFDFDSIGDRMDRYCKHARDYNSSIKGNWKDGSLGTIYRAQLHFIEIELNADLTKLKDNNGKLGFLPQVSHSLDLPSPRNFDEQKSSKAEEPSNNGGNGGQLPDTAGGERVAVFMSSRVLTVLLVILCLAAVSDIVMRIVPFVKNTSFSSSPAYYPLQFANDDNTTPVEKIRCTQPLITVYPGVKTSLPIEVTPNEAIGAFLLCDSSDETVLTGIDGVIAYVRASECSEPGVSSAKVSVIVRPLYPKSSDVFIEVPVEVDYTAPIPESLYEDWR